MKYGFVKITSRTWGDYIYKVRIVEEFENHYHLKYVELVEHNGWTYRPKIHNAKRTPKHEVFDIYEKQVNWLQKVLITIFY